MHAIVTAEAATSPDVVLVVRQLREHHPAATITVVVTHPLQLAAPVPGATSTVSARHLTVAGVRYIDAWLGGGPAFARWALVPAMAELVGHAEPVLVLPAESRVLAPLDDLTDHVARIGLVPRAHDAGAAIASDGWVPDLAVIGPDSAAAMAWWADVAAAAYRCAPTASAIDLDDPWRTFSTAGDGITLIPDASVRLSPWSVAHLRLAIVDGAITVDDRPVRLAQFPAFDVERPWWYSTSQADDPAVLTSGSAPLRRLCLEHAADLAAAIGTGDTTSPKRSLVDILGVRHSDALREEVRVRTVAAMDAGELPPNPFDPESAEQFFSWLRDPADAELTGVSVAADLVWRERPDLAAAFPHVRWGDRDNFLRWLWIHGLKEGLISTALLPDLPGTATPATVISPSGTDELKFGVNLVGYHDSDLGLGVAVRRVAAALDAAAIPWTKVTYDRTHSRRRREGGGPASAAAPYRYNLILIAPDQLAFFVDDVGTAFLDGRYNIGLWYWETDVLSDRQVAALGLIDEIWGSTQYLVDIFAAHTTRPVVRIPVPLEFRQAPPTPGRREALGLDERFTFLFTFDFFSIVERKNPLELVEAYTAAFSPEDGCRLILKSINGARHLSESEELRAAFGDRDDIELWDRYLDADERLALVADVDCYVSLHRSEGLGLTMAEAMAAGTPVIATGYSGNLDFMLPGSALLVDATEIEIGPGSFYPEHGHWAQPDLAHATDLLRQVRFDDALRARLAAAGPRALRPFTAKRVGASIAERLDVLDRS
ncbi:MAG TPA: glycosyltransferase [Microthrixaceae bacterium]|jgi:glycosyltransferase involved in cell wall biosynthesis|nr:glycosyltransferase [Microthrixaceae bacterium]